ncbi:MAG: hypothetical protein DIU60_004950, partial [Actinomycetes bacterium]
MGLGGTARLPVPSVGDVLAGAIRLTVAGTAALVNAPVGAVRAARRVPAAVEEGLGLARRVRRYGERVHIGLLPGEAMTPERAKAIESALTAHPGVAWASVNAPLGRVIAELRDPGVDPAELVAIVADAGAAAAEMSEGPEADHAGPEARVSPVLMLAADMLGLAITAVQRVTRWTPLPAEIPAMLGFVDAVPPLRRIAAAAVPAHLLPLATAAAQTLAPGMAGLTADVFGRLVQWREVRAAEAAFRLREAELCGTPERARAWAAAPSRVSPLGSGMRERHAHHALAAAAGCTAAGLLAGDLRRGLQVGLAALPRAAATGQEGFAAELGTVLARRGAVVVRPAALRRLDRIDTVVADAEVLLSPEPSIGEVIVLPGADAEEAAERVHALFDPAEFRHGALGSGPGAATVPGGRAVLRGENGWTLGPVELLDLTGRRGERERRRLAATGPLA